MKIYTGYFGQVKKYRAAGLTTVSIARFRPRFYSGLQYPTLAPTPKMLKLSLDEYDVQFKRILAGLAAPSVRAELEVLAEGRDIVLLCYEKIGEYCHRHLVSEWLRKNGIECQEYLFSVPPDVKFDKPEQGFFNFE